MGGCGSSPRGLQARGGGEGARERGDHRRGGRGAGAARGASDGGGSGRSPSRGRRRRGGARRPRPAGLAPGRPRGRDARPRREDARLSVGRDTPRERPRSPSPSDRWRTTARSSERPPGEVRARSGRGPESRQGDEHEDAWPISVMCRVPGVSVSGRSRLALAAREREGQGRPGASRGHPPGCRAAIGDAHGAPRVHAALRALGRRVGRRRVARRARRAGPRGLAALARGGCAPPNSRHGHPIAPDRPRPARARRRGGDARPGVAGRSGLRAHRGAGSTSPRRWTSTPARPSAGRCAARRTARVALEALETAAQRQRPGPGADLPTRTGASGARASPAGTPWPRPRSRRR